MAARNRRVAIRVAVASLIAVLAGAAAAGALWWTRRGAGPNEVRDLTYAQFRGIVGIDRWGLDAAERIDYWQVERADRDDQFIRARMAPSAFEVAVSVFRGEQASAGGVGELDREPMAAEWSPEPPPAWWETEDRGEVRRVLFLREGETPGGTLWEYRPASEVLQIWDWLGRADGEAPL